jgi:hypothetical protein
MQNIPGKRYGVHPSIKYETYKGQSHITFVDVDPESRKPWKTTNQVGGWVRPPAGMVEGTGAAGRPASQHWCRHADSAGPACVGCTSLNHCGLTVRRWHISYGMLG